MVNAPERMSYNLILEKKNELIEKLSEKYMIDMQILFENLLSSTENSVRKHISMLIFAHIDTMFHKIKKCSSLLAVFSPIIAILFNEISLSDVYYLKHFNEYVKITSYK
jgi:hypothetical protein